ncbi:MAG TPA: response regulator [Thermoanaerobaculia bacterium]|nr:response regulator [Thermoanaerobaculia bacterium]
MTNTILLADDSVTIQKVIELTFMDEDYEVVAVGNGDEALDQLEELMPDVVIADVHMPGASGYDVARRAKQLHPQAPVLLLVGTFEPFDNDDYESCGADDYLKKPFDSQELLQRVSDLMAARAGMDRPVAPPVAAPQAEKAPAADSAAEWAPPAAEPPPGGDVPPAGGETRFVPTAEGQESGSWRPADESGEDPGLGTRRMPTFGTAAEPVEQERASSGWDLAGEPEEVAPAVEPVADDEPAWAGGEPFEPAWDSVETPEPADDEDAETPSWALDETGDAGSADRPEGATEAAEAWSPPPAAGEATPAEATAEAPPAAERARHGDPFPELSRPQPAATPTVAVRPSEPAAKGDTGEGRLSADDVDRVARRVVELLGDQVVREVAWEVVPDLAEVVIKDRLRELESQVD